MATAELSDADVGLGGGELSDADVGISVRNLKPQAHNSNWAIAKQAGMDALHDIGGMAEASTGALAHGLQDIGGGIKRFFADPLQQQAPQLLPQVPDTGQQMMQSGQQYANQSQATGMGRTLGRKIGQLSPAVGLGIATGGALGAAGLGPAAAFGGGMAVPAALQAPAGQRMDAFAGNLAQGTGLSYLSPAAQFLALGGGKSLLSGGPSDEDLTNMAMMGGFHALGMAGERATPLESPGIPLTPQMPPSAPQVIPTAPVGLGAPPAIESTLRPQPNFPRPKPITPVETQLEGVPVNGEENAPVQAASPQAYVQGPADAAPAVGPDGQPAPPEQNNVGQPQENVLTGDQIWPEGEQAPAPADVLSKGAALYKKYIEQTRNKPAQQGGNPPAPASAHDAVNENIPDTLTPPESQATAASGTTAPSKTSQEIANANEGGELAHDAMKKYEAAKRTVYDSPDLKRQFIGTLDELLTGPKSQKVLGDLPSGSVKVYVDKSSPYKYENGKMRQVFGGFNPETGDITIQGANTWHEGQLLDLLAHEGTHAARIVGKGRSPEFDTAYTERKSEASANKAANFIKGTPNEQPPAPSGAPEINKNMGQAESADAGRAGSAVVPEVKATGNEGNAGNAQEQVAPEPDPTVSLRKGDIDADRERLGLNRIDGLEKKKFVTANAKAKEMGLKDKIFERAQDVLDNDARLTMEETAGAAHRIGEIQNRRIFLQDKIDTAATDRAEKAFAQAEIDKGQQEADTIWQAVRKSGRASGQENAMKAAAWDLSGNLTEHLAAAREAKGSDLTPEERGFFERTIKERDATIAKHEAEMERLQHEKASEVVMRRARSKVKSTNKSYDESFAKVRDLLRSGCGRAL